MTVIKLIQLSNYAQNLNPKKKTFTGFSYFKNT